MDIILLFYGEMAEWLKAYAWKAYVGEISPRVRIPFSPPVYFFNLPRIHATKKGMIETNIIPKVIRVRLSFTKGILPNKNPPRAKAKTHKNPPTKLYARKVEYSILPTPATKGAIVRTIGTNLAITIVFLPCFS